jgi:hypothetical protein
MQSFLQNRRYSHVPHRSVLLGVVTLSLSVGSRIVSADDFTIGLNFRGLTLNDDLNLGSSNSRVADTMGAVGPNHIVELLNGAYAVFDKSTGAVVGTKISDAQFWKNAGITSFQLGQQFDPRVIYDSQSQRWFATQLAPNDVGNGVRLAVSNDSDPTHGWKAVYIPVESREPALFADFDTLGLNADGVYIGTYNLRGDGAPVDYSLFSIPKADLTAATPTLAHMTRFDGLTENTHGAVLQPAVNFGPSNGSASVLAASGAFGGKVLKRSTVLNAAGPGPATLSPAVSINVPTYVQVPDAHHHHHHHRRSQRRLTRPQQNCRRGLGLLQCQHRHHCVVGTDDVTLQHPLNHQLVQRIEQVGHVAAPDALRGPVDLKAVTLKDVLQSVEWKVVTVFTSNDIRQ